MRIQPIQQKKNKKCKKKNCAWQTSIGRSTQLTPSLLYYSLVQLRSTAAVPGTRWVPRGTTAVYAVYSMGQKVDSAFGGIIHLYSRYRQRPSIYQVLLEEVLGSWKPCVSPLAWALPQSA